MKEVQEGCLGDVDVDGRDGCSDGVAGEKSVLGAVTAEDVRRQRTAGRGRRRRVNFALLDPVLAPNPYNI